MRHIANELKQRGWQVEYGALSNSGSIIGEIARAHERHAAAALMSTKPGEWRLRDEFERVLKQQDTEKANYRFQCHVSGGNELELIETPST